MFKAIGVAVDDIPNVNGGIGVIPEPEYTHYEVYINELHIAYVIEIKEGDYKDCLLLKMMNGSDIYIHCDLDHFFTVSGLKLNK